MDNKKKDDEINIIDFVIKCKQWFLYLLSNWKIIIIAGTIGVSTGLVYSLLDKPSYTATLTFVLEDNEKSGFGGALGLASQFGFDLGVSGGGAFTGANILELFKSRSMVEKTLLAPITYNGETISFAEMYIRDLKWREQWQSKGIFKGIQFLPNGDRSRYTRQQDSIVGIIFASLSGGNLNVIQKDKDVEIITIEIKSTNEYFAKYFAEALASQVSEFYILSRNKKSRENLEILQKQTDSIRAELNRSIMGVAAATDDVFNLNPAMNVRRVPSSRRQIDVQANGAMLVELVKQTELAKVTLRKETPLIQVIDHPILPLAKKKMGKLRGMILFGFLATVLISAILLLHQLVNNRNREKAAG